MATTGSATPAGRTAGGNSADGLKTHISTALSGLLDRALGSRAEQGVTHGTPALPAVQKSELAREMHRLIMAPTPARLVLLKAAERAAGVDTPEPYPYSCLYCNCGFEHMKTRNRHMGHAHKREMYGNSSMTEKSEDDPDDCEGSDHKSKPPVTGSPAPECPVESDDRSVTTGAEATGGSSESVASAVDSAAGAPADLPQASSRSLCSELPAGEEVTVAVAGVTERPEDSGSSVVQTPTSSLARELHRLIRAPAPARLVLQRASERASGVDGPDPYPFPCLYCECRFEQESTCNRHMGRAHPMMVYPDLKWEEMEDDPGGEAPDCGWQEPKVSIWTPETPGADEEGGDGDFLCPESKPPVAGSGASEYPGEPDGRPVATGVGTAGGSSGPVAAAAVSVADAPADSSPATARPPCDELPVREEAAVADVAEEPDASESATGAAASDRGDDARGLKTHISTAFGGLLERAVGSRLEKGLVPSSPSLARPERGRRQASASTSTPSSRGRSHRRIFATDLAKQVRENMSRWWSRTTPPTLRCAPDSVPQGDSLRYACLYCDRRFDLQTSLLWHVKIDHKNQIISTSSKDAETEGNSDDASADEDDCSWQESKVSVWSPERPSEEVGGDDDFVCSESKPLLTGSPTPECPAESDDRPVTTAEAEAEAEAGGSSRPSAADSVAAAPADSPHAPALPLCGELPVGDEAAVVDLTEEPEASESATGAAATGFVDEARGLKTHISTAFGGLLERAVISRLEKGLIPRPRVGRGRARVSTPAPAARGRRRRIYATDLAKRVRQHLSSGPPRTPTPRLRYVSDAAPRGSRYTCLYCDDQFDFRSSLQWHMKTDHGNEKITSILKEEDSEDISDDELPCEDDYCESKPPVEECPASEWSDVCPRGAAVADAGRSPPPRAETAPADTPRVPPHQDCRELPSGRDAPPGRGADENSGSVPSTDPTAAAAAPPGRGTQSVGLKTHISTALGGLLERAAGTHLEMGDSAHLPGRERPPCASVSVSSDCSSHRYVCFYCEIRFNNLGSHMWHVKHEHKDESIFSELKQTEPGDDVSTGGDCDHGWQEQRPTNCPSETAGEVTVRIRDYLCSGWQEQRPTNCPSETAGEDTVRIRDYLCSGWQEQRPTNCPSETAGEDTVRIGDYLCSECGAMFVTLHELLSHEKEEHAPASAGGRHSSSTETASAVDGHTSSTETASARDGHSSSTETAVWQDDETDPLKSPGPDTDAIFIKEEAPEEMGPLASPQPEIETIFIKEETSAWESPDDVVTAQDPLSFEEEVQEDPVVGSGFSSCIKEEPDIDLTMDSSDSTEAVTRGHTSDITRTAVTISTRPSLSEVGGIGRTAPISSHLDGGHEDDDTSTADTVTSVGDPVTPFGVADTDRANTTAGTAPGPVSDDDTKPPYCYAELIAMAIENSPNRRAKVTEICAYILNHFPYYRNRKAWQKSVRVNLSMHKCFVKVYGGRIRNNYWMIDPKYKAMFENGNYRRQSKQSVVSDAEVVSRPHYVLDPVHRLQHLSVDSELPGDTEDSGGDIGNGDGTVLPFASLHRNRSPPVYDGSNTASFEEQNVQSAVHNEVVKQREKSTESIGCGVSTQDNTSREDNPICSTDNMSTMDSDFPAFTCSSCLQSFPSKYSLIMHVFTHIDSVEPPSHICRDCGEVFLCDDSLNEHLKIRGSGKMGKVCSPSGMSPCQESSTSLVHKKPYKCNACSKSFAFSCYLQIQKCANRDYGKKLHECEVCGKLFPRVYDLKLHLLVHSGLKSLNCDVCDKLFATVEELKSHSAVHRVANTHKCGICGKSFDTLASLKSHVVQHSVVESHKCDDCGKLFARVGKFELLLSVHSGTKSLACSVCGKPFKSALNLRRHMHMHT